MCLNSFTKRLLIFVKYSKTIYLYFIKHFTKTHIVSRPLFDIYVVDLTTVADALVAVALSLVVDVGAQLPKPLV